MSRRWIIVDTSVKPGGTRFLGAEDWSETVRGAVPFTSREAAQKRFDNIRFAHIRERSVVRPVAPAGTKHDAVAVLRAELDGLRATDAACASALALAQQQAAGWAASYHHASEREERTRRALGAQQDETTDDAARRVAGELAELRRAIECIVAGARL